MTGQEFWEATFLRMIPDRDAALAAGNADVALKFWKERWGSNRARPSWRECNECKRPATFIEGCCQVCGYFNDSKTSG